jgi:alkylation response protein AidB-like acyl-CoA dehydrogenase
MTTLAPVEFDTTPERQALSEMLRDFFSKESAGPPADVAGPVDRASWKMLGSDLGVLGLDVAENLGGGGGATADAAELYREAGRACSSLPLLAFAPVSALLAAAGHELLSDILRGATLASVVGVAPAAGSAVTATLSGSDVRLDGHVAAVLGGASADVLIVVAEGADGDVVALVDGSAAGHSARAATSFDLSRQWSQHTFDAVTGKLVTFPAGQPDVNAAADIARIAAAADLVGIAEAAIEEVVEYAKIRYQFGRAIGSQQAIKHRIVDMSISVERAIATLEYAVRAPDVSRSLGGLIALESATTAGVQVCTDAIQILGGIGMTWEHVGHIRLRRVLANQAAFGTPEQHRHAIAAALWPVQSHA